MYFFNTLTYVNETLLSHFIQVEDIGLDYMTSAARQRDLGSVLYLASAYDTGLNLGSDRKVIAPAYRNPPLPPYFCKRKNNVETNKDMNYVVDVKTLNNYNFDTKPSFTFVFAA